MKWIYHYLRADHNWVPRGPFDTQEAAQQDIEKHALTAQEPTEVEDDWEPHECRD